MNEELKNQLIDTYFVIEQNLGIQSKPINYVLKEFGDNIKSMLKDRQTQVNNQMREHGRSNRGMSPRTDKLGNPYEEQVDPDTSRALIMSPGMKRKSIVDLPPKVRHEASLIFDGTSAILAEEMGHNPNAAATIDREPLGGGI